MWHYLNYYWNKFLCILGWHLWADDYFIDEPHECIFCSSLYKD